MSILEKIKEIREKIDNDIEINMDDYTELKKNNPLLFDLAINKEKKFDINILENMLKMKEKIDNGEETLKSSSEKISMKYFKEFHPNIKNI
jgi:3-polyprenyl-4-hydroxybenzoate decarboxylase